LAGTGLTIRCGLNCGRIYAGCIGDTSGCTPVTKGALGGGWALAVTNDGTQLYAPPFAGTR